MAIIPKKILKSERLTLKIIDPSISFAQTMFETIDQNRTYLETWLGWVQKTQKVEDSFAYLLHTEKQIDKIEYGIFIKNIYIGNISIFDSNKTNKSAEIGYWLSAVHTGNGYMTEAVGLLEKYAFEKLGLHRIQIKCDEANLASISVAKKSKYVYEGTLREVSFNAHFNNFRNMLVFSKLASEYNK